jgi:hypothetical protein
MNQKKEFYYNLPIKRVMYSGEWWEIGELLLKQLFIIGLTRKLYGKMEIYSIL